MKAFILSRVESVHSAAHDAKAGKAGETLDTAIWEPYKHFVIRDSIVTYESLSCLPIAFYENAPSGSSFLICTYRPSALWFKK